MNIPLYTVVLVGLCIPIGAQASVQEPTFRVPDSKSNALNLDSTVVKDIGSLKGITPSQKRRLEEVGRAARDLVRPEQLTPQA